MNIFVFGSNLAGRHGKGAAWDAAQYYGAEWGIGEGLTGESYAIPTKDENLKTLPLESIQKSIFKFLDFAESHPKYLFILTPIGTGLAGYTIDEIKNCFDLESVPDNVLFTNTWFK